MMVSRSLLLCMSFAIQSLMSEYLVKNTRKLAVKVHTVPEKIDEIVSRLKLKSMNINIDTLTREQKKYLSSWTEGT